MAMTYTELKCISKLTVWICQYNHTNTHAHPKVYSITCCIALNCIPPCHISHGISPDYFHSCPLHCSLFLSFSQVSPQVSPVLPQPEATEHRVLSTRFIQCTLLSHITHGLLIRQHPPDPSYPPTPTFTGAHSSHLRRMEKAFCR